MKITNESLVSCMTTQLIDVAGIDFAEHEMAAQDAFVAEFDRAMTASMHLLEERVRAFGSDVVVRWGNPALPGRLQIRRGKLEWVE